MTLNANPKLPLRPNAPGRREVSSYTKMKGIKLHWFICFNLTKSLFVSFYAVVSFVDPNSCKVSLKSVSLGVLCGWVLIVIVSEH